MDMEFIRQESCSPEKSGEQFETELELYAI